MSPRSRSSERRFARRAWSRRWPALRRMLVGLLVLGLVAGAGWLVFVSSALAVERVVVTGARTVPAHTLTEAAAVPIGEPLARVEVDDVRRRVEQVPVVEQAEIARTWPHTVSITVTERTPVAAVRTATGYRLIDDDGVQFRTVRQAPRNLPVLLVHDNPRAAAEAAAVVSMLPSGLAARVSRVRAATMDSIRLELRDGRSVVWGSAEDSALKADVLSALIERKATVYDVSVPGAPTVTVG